VFADKYTRHTVILPRQCAPYFNGQSWNNDISTKYAINSIPATFLLDQSGNIVALNLHGERLEAEVRRLLKL
jgi:hypothetical protein